MQTRALSLGDIGWGELSTSGTHIEARERRESSPCGGGPAAGTDTHYSGSLRGYANHLKCRESPALS